MATWNFYIIYFARARHIITYTYTYIYVCVCVVESEHKKRWYKSHCIPPHNSQVCVVFPASLISSFLLRSSLPRLSPTIPHAVIKCNLYICLLLCMRSEDAYNSITKHRCELNDTQSILHMYRNREMTMHVCHMILHMSFLATLFHCYPCP